MLKARVISLAGEKAVLSLEDGQSVTVSMADIEGVPKVGQDIVIVVAALGSEDAGRQKLAQDLLNTLLNA